MSKWRHSIGRFTATAVLAMTLVAAGGKPARAGCSFDDLVNAFSNLFEGAYSFLQKPECAAHLGDPAFWVLAGAVSVTAMHSPGMVRNTCAEVQDWKKKLTGGVKDAQELKDKADTWLRQLGVSDADRSKISSAIDDKLAAAGDIASVMNFFGCACSMSQMASQPTQVANDCIVGALCWLDEFVFGNSCNNAKKPMELRDCTDKYSGIYNNGDYRCDARGFCISGNVSRTGYSGMACFCPKPMVMVRTQWEFCQHAPGAYSGTFDCYHCSCPKGSKPAGDTELLRRICVCPDGNLVGADGRCPPPPPKTACGCSCPSTQIVTKEVVLPNGQCRCECGCKEGQQLIGGGLGKCITPCSDPLKIRLANGSCCWRGQVSACGTCCPIGMKPDATSGSCVSYVAPQPPALPAPPKKL